MGARTVVKLGGSLIKKGLIQDSIQKIEEMRDQEIVVIIGGGHLADGVRSFDDLYSLSDESAHWSAIKCMDINSQMVEDISSNLECISRLDNISKLIERGKTPIFETLKYIRNSNDIPHSWEFTSDSIAASVAADINADQLVLVKDVEGIYQDGKLVERIDKGKLEEHVGTCVDRYLSTVVNKEGLNCSVVSGERPDRIEKAIKGKEFTGTKIC